MTAHTTRWILLVIGNWSLVIGECSWAAEEPYNPYKYVRSADQAIQLFQDRVRRDPKDFMSYTLLGQMHIRKAREMNDLASYDRAETAIRRALELNRSYVAARANLALILCAQHKFAEGLGLAQQLYRENPGQPQLLMLIGDAHLELGNYAAAEKAYQDLQKKDPLALVHSRRARLAELKGKPREALELMRLAAQEEGHASIGKEGIAWYEFRLGEMLFQAGRLGEAATHYEAALRLHPRYPMSLAFLGKVRAGQGKYDEAIKLYAEAVAVNADLAMLADLGDLYAHTGKTFLAQLNYTKLEKTAQGRAAYDRELSLFYSNHDRKLAEALKLARRDLGVRQDIYAYDTLAWALYKNDRLPEAAAAMDEALKLGTQDAGLYYHAGKIHARLGNKDKARGYLQRVQAINPHFSLLHAQDAQQSLHALGG